MSEFICSTAYFCSCCCVNCFRLRAAVSGVGQSRPHGGRHRRRLAAVADQSHRRRVRFATHGSAGDHVRAAWLILVPAHAPASVLRAVAWFTLDPIAGLYRHRLTAKEDAALLPLYTACAEFSITGFRGRQGRYYLPAVWTHVTLLLAPMLGGLLWIAPGILHGVSDFRGFSTVERLLTEPRVLVDYIQWTLFPNLNALTFYHDDLAVSHTLFDPATTLPAILVLLALLGIALWQRKTRPLFCLGILWFFAGHSMTATIIQLELVFEHRNYFPSAGLLLAGTSLIALEPGLRLPAARTLIGTGFIALFAFTTLLRAKEWSHPLRLDIRGAQTPAFAARPVRTRADADQSGRQGDKSPLLGKSVRILERNAFLPDSGIPH